MNEPSPAYLDHMARQRGFPSYQAWAAWNAQRSASLHNGSNTVVQNPQNPQAPQEQNFLQRLLAHSGASALLGYVGDRYHQATGF